MTVFRCSTGLQACLRAVRCGAGLQACLGLVVAACAAVALDAHKPVTSKYTFSEDVAPILKEQCGGCHVAGGIAPMSLMTYEDARPWAESIRLELTSGHMPPWYGDPGVAPLRDVHKLSPRELDVVLTWVTGGTPPGPSTRLVEPRSGQARAVVQRGWSRGRPDLVLPLPAPVSLPAGTGEATREFVLRDSNDRDRTIAFADLLPGNPAIVHDAIVFTRKAAEEPSTVVTAWRPGIAPVTPAGLGFLWKAGEQLVVRIHYKKNWKLENKPASDRSAVGLYLARSQASRPIRGIALEVNRPLTVNEHLEGVAVRSSTTSVSDLRVTLNAVRPDGSRVTVAGFTTRAGWDQRYWLAKPVDLPKGTKLEAEMGSEPFPAIHLWVDAVPAPF